jgi:hypothetical protein
VAAAQRVLGRRAAAGFVEWFVMAVVAVSCGWCATGLELARHGRIVKPTGATRRYHRRMGNIGKVKRKIILEPMPDDIPCPEIIPEPARHPEPVKVPA